MKTIGFTGSSMCKKDIVHRHAGQKLIKNAIEVACVSIEITGDKV